MAEMFFGGLERVLLWYYTTSGTYLGVATGQQTSLSNGATSQAYVITKPRAAGFNFDAGAQLQQQGGDRLGSLLSFATSSLASFDLTVDALDPNLVALIEQSTQNTTSTVFTKTAVNSDRAAPSSMGVCVAQRGVQSDGTPVYKHTFIPKAQVVIKMPGGTFRGEALVTITITPQKGTKMHTGQSYGSTGLNFGLANDTTDHYIWTSSYPLHITTFKSDGAATTFITAYRPVSSTITLNGTDNEMVKNTTATALSSISTTTGVATLSAAGTAGDLHVLTYSTNYVPV